MAFAGRLGTTLLALVILAGALPLSAAPVRAVSPGPLPACRVDDVLTPYRDPGDWQKTLLDHTFMLPADYVPPGLVRVADHGVRGNGKVRRFVIADLKALARAARVAGRPITVISGYRSYSAQAVVFRQHVERYGRKGALLQSARAGHSEHQLGTTVDLGSISGSKPWEHDFGSTPTGRWLRKHAWRFGFVMSYPAGRSPDQTCYMYEPWHFRYFGRELAARIRESGLSPREWLWRRGFGLEPDTTPPSIPADVTAEIVDGGTVVLSWSPSADDSGRPVRYRVMRSGVTLRVTRETTQLDVPPEPGAYRYRVRAIDASGNASPYSPPITVIISGR
ncbi:MAG TPA: D-alanyl-D-alanine carboxypeptidase family protein [Candidatus Limnocylindria bacterium]|nr:D-alanyl-D-alanine carboxypeptidase family protein [Candidatus Limnocylindria bacterium]